MRRRKFKLHAAFLNATMVSAVDAPVEFEVSIGKINGLITSDQIHRLGNVALIVCVIFQAIWSSSDIFKTHKHTPVYISPAKDISNCQNS